MGSNWLGANTKREFGFIVQDKLNMCLFATLLTHLILGWINNSVASKPQDVIIPLCLISGNTLKDVNKLERKREQQWEEI